MNSTITFFTGMIFGGLIATFFQDVIYRVLSKIQEDKEIRMYEKQAEEIKNRLSVYRQKQVDENEEYMKSLVKDKKL